MKPIYLFALLLLLICVSETGSAQSSYGFTYEGGKRVTRAIITLKSAKIAKDTLQAKKEVLIDQVGLQETRIYPNPTKGILKVDLPLLVEKNTTIRLYNSTGKLIIQQVAVESNNELNLSSYPPGLYIMSIQIGLKDRKDWKIIKE